MVESALMSVYSRLPVTFKKGQGVWLWDEKNNPYLDAIAGIGVCALGHAHPTITKAIIEQAAQLIHVSNLYHIAEQEALAVDLTRLAGMDKAFFCNSGAEANEAAIKIARLYGHQLNIDTPSIVVFEKSFHGRTLATISASSNRKNQAGYEPLVAGFVRAPINDLDALESIIAHGKNIIAVMLEPIVGNGGIIVFDDSYLAGVRALCDRYKLLLIVDEVQTGLGRTGKFFAYQHTTIKPDILTSAKALANGIPIAACLARGESAELFKPSRHGSTFGGNPFACHVARTVLQVLQNDNILENVNTIGSYLLAKLHQRLNRFSLVKDIRGQGLMIGIELDRPCREMVSLGLQEKILFNVTAETVIRLLPPLILNKEEADLIVDRLERCLISFMS